MGGAMGLMSNKTGSQPNVPSDQDTPQSVPASQQESSRQQDHETSTVGVVQSASATAESVAGMSTAYMRLHGVGSLSVEPSKFASAELGDTELRDWAASSKSAARALGLPQTKGEPQVRPKKRRSLLYVRKEAYVPAPGATYSLEKMEAELKVLIKASGLDLSQHEPLPSMMRVDLAFGLQSANPDQQISGAEVFLDSNQFELWRERVARWLVTSAKMREVGVHEKATALIVEGSDDFQEHIAHVLLRCPGITSLTLQRCTLSNGTVSSICHAVGKQLTCLDLSESKGFEEQDCKAIAVACLKLDTLKLVGSCGVGFGSLAAIAAHCKALTTIEVSEGAISEEDLARCGFPDTCIVKRVPQAAA